MGDLMTVRPLRGGTWNMERDRNQMAAAAEAVGLMRTHRLDYLLLQECGDYLHALAEWCTRSGDHRLISHNSDPGMTNTAILVNTTTLDSVGPGHQVRMTNAGWITVRGGHTGRKYMTTVLLDGWLQVGSVHLPVSERWMHGRISGPIRRVAAYVQHAKSLAAWITQHAAHYPKHAIVVGGDWNAQPNTVGDYTPQWIINQANARLCRAPGATHGDRIIDYTMGRGCLVSNMAVVERQGSDHHAVVFTVHP